MKILYFTQFYSPENIAAAFRAKDHSDIWSASGHDVTVFTGWPNYPIGRLFDGYDMVRLREERIGLFAYFARLLRFSLTLALRSESSLESASFWVASRT